MSPAVPALHQQALQLHRSGRLPEAERQYRAVLALDESHLDTHLNLGNLLLQRGRPREAIPHFEKVRALRPQARHVLCPAAAAYTQIHLRNEAIALYAEALQQNPGDVAILRPLVELYLATNRPREAVEKLQAAIASAPRFAAAYQLLARVYRFWGREREALDAVNTAIAIEPNNPLLYSALANIKRFGPGDAQIGVMESLLRRPMSAEVRIPLQFALAKAYTDTGEHDRAFATLLEANRHARSLTRYDERQYLEPYQRVKSVFSAELMRAKADVGGSSDTPIFILGVPRSGTTLVEQILASHPAVAGSGESSAFGETITEFWPDYPANASAVTAPHAARIAESYLAKLRALAGAAGRITDKHLNNVVFAGLLHLVFPKARFVHVGRDPVDTCLSGFANQFSAGQPYAYDLAELGRHYRAYESLMAHWHAVLPQITILRLRYEDLVADLEGQTRRLLTHCGLSWNPACLSFEKTERLVWTASAAQVREPLYTRSVGRFRPAPHLLQPLLTALGS